MVAAAAVSAVGAVVAAAEASAAVAAEPFAAACAARALARTVRDALELSHTPRAAETSVTGIYEEMRRA